MGSPASHAADRTGIKRNRSVRRDGRRFQIRRQRRIGPRPQGIGRKSVFTKPMLAASGAASLLLCGLGGPALSQTPPAGNGVTALPEIDVIAPKQVAGKPKQRAKPRVVARRAVSPRTASSPSTASAVSPETAAQVLAGKNEKFDEARRNIVAPTGAGSYQLNQQALEALPQGTNTPMDKVLLQTPGVSQDSAASGELACAQRARQPSIPHQRHHAARWRRRLRTNHRHRHRRQPGLDHRRAAGAIRLAHRGRPRHPDQGRRLQQQRQRQRLWRQPRHHHDVGSNMAARSDRPSISFPDAISNSNLGIENPTPAYNAIHDNTSQEKGFLYLSTVLDPTSRLTFMSGVSNGSYQIPNNPGQTPSLYRLRDIQFQFLAAQRTAERIQPVQRARLPEICRRHRLPALLFQPLQPVALSAGPDRRSGLQWRGFGCLPSELHQRHSGRHLLPPRLRSHPEVRLCRQRRTLAGEQRIDRCCRSMASGNPVDAPFSVFNSSAKTGWLFSTYLEDEWKITNNLTLNAGLRFDQMWQYVDANQLSPRVSLTWKPFDGTTFHAGYARNFTPPEQVLAAPTNLALVQGTTAQPASVPERSGAAGTLQRVRCRRRSEDLRDTGSRGRDRWLLQDRDRSAR